MHPDHFEKMRSAYNTPLQSPGRVFALLAELGIRWEDTKPQMAGYCHDTVGDWGALTQTGAQMDYARIVPSPVSKQRQGTGGVR